jgi:hypothetical protein
MGLKEFRCFSDILSHNTLGVEGTGVARLYSVRFSEWTGDVM